ncbi:AmpC Beta-lactamase class C and other penicillin binding protein [Pyrenophora tritici-repentis]|nr:AmpC Beta-lactamase class C and other penicillin binding protein [Pyrenophora tritici-repentis]KAF7446231.1 AmpC Beta-lactamase class C [Pyrenophora tritici-repentis]
MDDTLSAEFSEYASTIQELLRISGVPSLSFGVFHNGVNIYSHHAGQDGVQTEYDDGDKSLTRPQLPNDDTVYPVSCLSSLFLHCTIMRFIKEGVLNMDTPIREYIRAFEERDDDIGQRATLRDLLTHKSGFPTDKLWWQSTKASKTEIMQVAVHLANVSDFRMQKNYSKWNDFVVQTIVETVTGREYEEIVEELFKTPLGISSKAPSVLDEPNVAYAHEVLGDGRIKPVDQDPITRDECLPMHTMKHSLFQSVHALRQLVTAYDRQHWNGTGFTPGNLFVRVENVFSMMTDALQPGKPIHVTEHSDGCQAGFIIIPETRSGVICMSNATSAIGLCNIVGHQLVDMLTGDHVKERSLVKSISEAFQKQKDLHTTLIGRLSTVEQISSPHKTLLVQFEGLYQKFERNVTLRIRHAGLGLLVTVDGSEKRQLDLRRMADDKFVWLPRYPGDMLQGIEQEVTLSERTVQFEIDGSEVIALKWPLNPEFPPENSPKTTEAPKELYGSELMLLPPELRNMICIEALKTSTGNICMVPNGQGYVFVRDEMTPDNIVRPLNQTKNTNKQLKQQSRGLELTANDLFADGRHFDEFLRSNDVQLQACIRNLTLMGDFLSFDNPEEADLQRIINFANNNKSATVHIRLFGMHFDDNQRIFTFMGFIYLIKKVIRGQGAALFGSLDKRAKKWGRVERSGTNMNVSNVKFFPKDADFDEDTFRNKLEVCIRGNSNTSYMLLSRHNGDPEAIVDFVRECYNDGI